MARTTVARCEPAHLRDVRALYRRTFGEASEASFAQRYDWSRKANLAPGQTGEWVLLSDGGQVVGYLGALPVPYAVAGQRVLAHTTADFMVDPAFAFHGLSLMRECFRRFPRQVSLDDMAATKAVLGLFKARPVLTLARYAKALDARLLRGRTAWAGRLPESWLAAGRPALTLLDGLKRPLGLAGTQVVAFDARFDVLADRLGALGGARVHRDATYYRWRYGASSPQAGARAVAQLQPDGALAGYAVVVTGTGPEPAGHVLELVAPPPVSEARYLSLLVGALRELRAQGAYTAYAHVPERGPPDLHRALERLGFGPRPYRTTLFARPAPGDDLALGAALLDATGWDFQYGDAEVTHSAVV